MTLTSGENEQHTNSPGLGLNTCTDSVKEYLYAEMGSSTIKKLGAKKFSEYLTVTPNPYTVKAI